MPEIVHCPLCGKSRSKFLYASRVRRPVPPGDTAVHTHRWNKCAGCGLIYLNPRRTDDELRVILSRDDQELDQDFLFDSERAWEYLRKRKFLEKHMPGGRLVDAGCGFGFFQKSLGPNWQASGLETDSAAAALGRNRLGAAIRPTSLEQGELEARSCDAVTCWDTLDHVADPVAFLKHARAALKSGGVLCLSTADASAAVPRLAGPLWRYLQTLDHRYAFTRAWLRKALSATGFRAVSVETYNRGPDFLFPFVEQCAREACGAIQDLRKRNSASGRAPAAPAACVPMFHDIIFLAAKKI